MRAPSVADIEVTDIGDYPNHEPTFQDPYNAAGNINTANCKAPQEQVRLLTEQPPKLGKHEKEQVH